MCKEKFQYFYNPHNLHMYCSFNITKPTATMRCKLRSITLRPTVTA